MLGPQGHAPPLPRAENHLPHNVLKLDWALQASKDKILYTYEIIL